MRLQAKSTIDTAGDVYEQEADRVAGQVMRMPDAQPPHRCACGGGCPACRSRAARLAQGKPRVQAKRVQDGGSAGTTAPPVVHEVLRSPGQPLDAESRGFMESRLGHDFSGVRVHTDGRAAESAEAVDARAYTVGENIAFGEGEYSPHTLAGKRLLAHELTHVVHQARGPESIPALQRQARGEEEAAGGLPSITFKGCDQSPFSPEHVRISAENAFETAKTCPGIKSEALRKDILAGYNGLTIQCEPEMVSGSCAETIKSTKTVKLYKQSLSGAGCPSELAATLFHEVVHVAERWNLFHGDLPWDCGAACYGNKEEKRGDPSHCDYERSWVEFAGVSAGGAIPEKGSPTAYVRIYAGVEKRGPILSIFRPSLGIGVSIIGDTATDDFSAEKSKLFSVIGGLRFDRGKEGGAYFSLMGGPEIEFTGDGLNFGYEVGARAGYRWKVYDVSLNAGIEYDPTQRAGEEKMYTLGATFQIAPKVRR